MSLARPNRRWIFHRDRSPWAARMRAGLAVGIAIALVIAVKIAAPEIARAMGYDVSDASFGSAAYAASPDAPAVNCPIKGEITRGGERIYHLPGQLNYDDTEIRVLNGERWFCNEENARRAGWRKAQV